ncbi:MAG: DUF4279 domain-containing protein [Cytophagales bacterium]|nr:DUF4279 domain-containing protein [Cytophagales bacterium]
MLIYSIAHLLIFIANVVAAELIFDYLYLRETPQLADAVMGFGHFDTKIPARCAELYSQGTAPLIIFSGGVGAGSADLPAPEGVFFAEWLRRHHPEIPAERLVVESASTNTAENLRLTNRLLAEQHSVSFGNGIQKMLLVANAYRQRRVWLTCRKLFPDLAFVNTPPATTFDREAAMFQEKNEDFTAHLLGEVQRIVEYPQKDWIEYDVVPAEVMEAWRYLSKHQSQRSRPPMIPKIRFYIGLYSDTLSPDEISETLQLEPTDSWKKGDFTKYRRNLPQPSNFWAYGTEYEESWDINEQIRKVISQLDRNKLRELTVDKGVQAILEGVIEIYDSAPAIYLEKETIDFAYETGCSFDFDIYNLKNKKCKI